MSLAAAEKAKSTPDAMALADENGLITWAQLDSLLNRATNALLALGLEPGRRIGVFANNSAETVLAYLAGLHAGISAIPINYHLTADEVAYILTDAQAGLLFVGPETVEVGRAASALAGVATVIG